MNQRIRDFDYQATIDYDHYYIVEAEKHKEITSLPKEVEVELK